MGEIKCPVCGNNFTLDEELRLQDTTYCPACYSEFRIMDVDPPKLKKLSDDSLEDYEGFDDVDKDYENYYDEDEH